MKTILFSFIVMFFSIVGFAQTSNYTTLKICSQEYLEFNKEKNLYENLNTTQCINCKIIYNDYYVRVFEDNKETFIIEKQNFYKSSEANNTIYYNNKYSDNFMQIDNAGRWISFGNAKAKFVYNFCLN